MFLVTYIFIPFRLVSLALSRWREQRLRADNTTVIILFFEEGGSKPCKPKLPSESPQTESQTDTDTASEVSAEMTRENTTKTSDSSENQSQSDLTPSSTNLDLDCDKPALVRSLAFRCSEPKEAHLSPSLQPESVCMTLQ